MRVAVLVIVLVGLSGLLVLAIKSAQASKLYRISGEVVGVTRNTLSIRRGAEILEFARPAHLGLPKKGDRITVLYHLDAKQISPAPDRPHPTDDSATHPALPSWVPDGAPGEVPGTLDDRAFYNAKNQVRPTRKNSG